MTNIIISIISFSLDIKNYNSTLRNKVFEQELHWETNWSFGALLVMQTPVPILLDKNHECYVASNHNCQYFAFMNNCYSAKYKLL